MNDLARRLKYISWAARKQMTAANTLEDTLCPACKKPATPLHRKLLVLSLMECDSCGLRFRVPKDDPSVTEYYDNSYSEDYPAQRPPDAEELARLTRTGVLDHPANNYLRYIEVLKAVGLRPGDSVVDFGCSWGYGSWQLREAGFKVYSMEVSRLRAEYAGTAMGCTMVESASRLPETVQCFFSSHVIEHLPDPALIWAEATKCLRPDGYLIVFCPNGEPEREALIGRKRYDYLWPQVHPMVITPKFMRTLSRRHRFSAGVYSEPYDLDAIASHRGSVDLSGEELLLVAHRDPDNAQ
jgi:2-polyprenyl-3-methyl-5-hydroxy-6-metoxy-1,4-benzoquinol methylase